MKKLTLRACALLLALPLGSAGQDDTWDTHMQVAAKMYHRGNYAEAEKLWAAALRQAEKFGPHDPRLADTLNNLALVYDAQGSYAKAEPLYERAFTIWEKTLGPAHPNVATSLNNLGLVYHAQGK